MRPICCVLAVVLFGPPFAARGADLRVPKDYATIQAAVDAAVLGDTVVVEKGTYDENVVLDGKIGMGIVGEGKVVLRGDGSGPVLTIGNASLVGIEGLTIEGGNGGLQLNSGVTAIRIEDVTVKDCSSYGIRNSGATLVTIVDCTVKNIDGTGRGIHVYGVDTVIKECTVKDVAGPGIWIEEDRCSVIDCKVVRAGAEGINVDTEIMPGTLGQLLVAGNQVEDCANGIAVSATHQDVVGPSLLDNTVDGGLRGIVFIEGDPSVDAEQAQIAGNVVRGCEAVGISLETDLSGGSFVYANEVKKSAGSGISAAGEGHLVSANTVKKPEGVGIEVSGQFHIVSSNVVRKAGSHGASLDGSGTVFSMNVLKKPQGSGVVLAESASLCRVEGNTVKKAGQYGLEIHGQDNEIVGNVSTKSAVDGLLDDGSDNTYQANDFD